MTNPSVKKTDKNAKTVQPEKKNESIKKPEQKVEV